MHAATRLAWPVRWLAGMQHQGITTLLHWLTMMHIEQVGSSPNRALHVQCTVLTLGYCAWQGPLSYAFLCDLGRLSCLQVRVKIRIGIGIGI